MTAPTLREYRTFLEAKALAAKPMGVPIVGAGFNPICKPHQAAIARWMVEGGRRACFADFGLGKGTIQQEVVRLVLERVAGYGLIICPLGVHQEFLRDAKMLGNDLRFVRTTEEMVAGGPGMYLTNYESVREGKIDMSMVTVVSLDEAAVLTAFGGNKVFREFMARIAGDDRIRGVQTDGVPYRFVATATPAPNEYIEILAYAAFLGIMDVGEAKTRFFKRNPEKADELTLYPHKEEEFWLWVSTWAVFLQKPSDLGFSDEGYTLPKLYVNWHELSDDDGEFPIGRDGESRLIADSSLGVQQEAAARRRTLLARIEEVRQLVESYGDDHVLLWHDLEDERHELECVIPGLRTVYGSQDLDERVQTIMDFADGAIARLGAKPVMLGAGVNLQRHCHRAIFCGPSYKFRDFIQAIHRLYRYLQPHDVTIDAVYAKSQKPIVERLQTKWKRHDEMRARMAEIIRQYGLNSIKATEKLQRSIGIERREIRGDHFVAVNNDCVEETMAMEPDSIGLIVTSIPFGTQYEYTPSYNDFGHTDDDAHFFRQMDFLTPELYRVLKPGRVLCVHVKDRVRPGGLDGFGFQSISGFIHRTAIHFLEHGFASQGMITIATDVVRENAQTYRLGWSEQCKDGSRMGVGLPEYVLLFRKPPTDASDGYADERVVKSKDEYSRARWQIDAHAVWRSNGNRLLTPDDLLGLPADEVYRRFRAFNVATIYDYETHVAIGEALDRAKRLPPGFSLIPVAADALAHPGVWSDVMRARTLNGVQAAKGREMHLCPLQFDVVTRLITRFSNLGDVVYDPFAGLFTVPSEAVKLGRIGRGVELNPWYFEDGVYYCRAAERKALAPSLFSFIDGAVDESVVETTTLEPV
jgi:DNA modification methylase